MICNNYYLRISQSATKIHRQIAPDGFDLFHVSAFWAKLKLEGVVEKDKKEAVPKG